MLKLYRVIITARDPSAEWAGATVDYDAPNVYVTAFDAQQAAVRLMRLYGVEEGGWIVRARAIRAENIRRRFENKERPLWWSTPEFPLIDLKMTRQDCIDFLKPRVPHETPRSACVYCPFKSASEWLRTKSHPKAWARALQIDRALRTPGVIANRNMDQLLYLHRSCLPLDQIDFEAEAKRERERYALPLFDNDFSANDCGEGMCGV